MSRPTHSSLLLPEELWVNHSSTHEEFLQRVDKKTRTSCSTLQCSDSCRARPLTFSTRRKRTKSIYPCTHTTTLRKQTHLSHIHTKGSCRCTHVLTQIQSSLQNLAQHHRCIIVVTFTLSNSPPRLCVRGKQWMREKEEKLTTCCMTTRRRFLMCWQIHTNNKSRVYLKSFPH